MTSACSHHRVQVTPQRTLSSVQAGVTPARKRFTPCHVSKRVRRPDVLPRWAR